MRWNEANVDGKGPSLGRTKLYASGFEKVLENLFEDLQPVHSDGTMCSVLVGSPGPNQMKFASIPCNMTLPMSGVLCVKGNTAFVHGHQTLYQINHVLVWKNEFILDNIGTFFNIARLQSHLSAGLILGLKQNNSEYFQLPADNLSPLLYFRDIHEYNERYRWTWNEYWYNCSDGYTLLDTNIRGETICRLNNQNVNKNARLHWINRYVQVPFSNETRPLSVFRSDYDVVALFHCNAGWVVVNGVCIQLFPLLYDDSEVGLRKGDLDQMCAIFAKGSTVWKSDKNNAYELLDKYNTYGHQLAFENDLGECTVIPQTTNETNDDCVADYVICSSQPLYTRCPTHYFKCSGQCIMDVFKCDGYNDCRDGADEANCSGLCSAGVDSDPQFCSTQCHPDNCTCNELYFQCPEGGCIQSYMLCNGVPDCVGGGDEKQCIKTYGQYTSREDGSLRSIDNDFIPDKEGAPDETIYIEILKGKVNVQQEYCDPLNEIPCMKGHPACYEKDRQCLYDNNKSGHLMYCRNGAHLRDYHAYQCSGSFKCQGSYRIPPYKLCDGILDCPLGEDEKVCPV